MGFPSEYVAENPLFITLFNCRSTKIPGVSASKLKEFYCTMDVEVEIWSFLMLVLYFGNWLALHSSLPV